MDFNWDSIVETIPSFYIIRVSPGNLLDYIYLIIVPVALFAMIIQSV